ncbi:MAG TPA: hypothetical protein VMV04_01295 [Thermodesulfobacteriota bacterium]|nr:hypothetical protein [Thermodesulfobacteriota bacterium]
MPLIHKRRIWWKPVPEATSYVVYVSKDEKIYNPAKFLWENTPDIVSKPVIGKTELILPDEWPEFPKGPGTYHIGITSRDDVGNQSDPFLLSGLFKFLAPPSPTKGGIESLSLVHSIMRQGRMIIQGGLEEVRDNEEVLDEYLGGS